MSIRWLKRSSDIARESEPDGEGDGSMKNSSHPLTPRRRSEKGEKRSYVEFCESQDRTLPFF